MSSGNSFNSFAVVKGNACLPKNEAGRALLEDERSYDKTERQRLEEYEHNNVL